MNIFVNHSSNRQCLVYYLKPSTKRLCLQRIRARSPYCEARFDAHARWHDACARPSNRSLVTPRKREKRAQPSSCIGRARENLEIQISNRPKIHKPKQLEATIQSDLFIRPDPILKRLPQSHCQRQLKTPASLALETFSKGRDLRRVQLRGSSISLRADEISRGCSPTIVALPHTYICICINTSIYICKYTCTHIQTHLSTHTNRCICMCIHIQIHQYTSATTSVYIHKDIYIHTQMQLPKYTHIYTFQCSIKGGRRACQHTQARSRCRSEGGSI